MSASSPPVPSRLRHHLTRERVRRAVLTSGLTGGLVLGAGLAGVAAAPAASATPAPAAAAGTPLLAPTTVAHPLLRLGARGPSVVHLQRLLHIPADGDFGPQTLHAVRAFQAAHHLLVDGEVGAHTWAALDGGRAGWSTTRATLRGPILRLGAQGGYVVAVQHRLHIPADGDFGPQTLHAVRAFQAAHHLLVDGEVGPHTWAALAIPATGVERASRSTTRAPLSLGQRAVAIAAQQEGKPYQYGAAGPNAFDCSGLVKYVFGRLGYDLPHNADAQFRMLRRVSKAGMRVGDILSIPNSNGVIVHNGIYAGGHSWWVARHSGTTITRQALYTDNFYVSRVG